MTKDEERKKLLQAADRELGGAHAMASHACGLVAMADPSNDDLDTAAALLHKASQATMQAALKRRRAKE